VPRAEGKSALEEVEGSIHRTRGGGCFGRPCGDTGSRIQGLTGPGLAIQAPVDIARGALPFTLPSQNDRAIAPRLDESRGRLEGLGEKRRQPPNLDNDALERQKVLVFGE